MLFFYSQEVDEKGRKVVKMKNELFIGVGVGPGDPELVTVKAMRAIQNADVIIAPRTEKKEGSVAFEIAKVYIRPETEVLQLIFPMNFDADSQDFYWEAARDEIVRQIEAGKKVVFLTLGDPMLYSTYIYVFRLLQKVGIEGTTIPGINSFSAIASHLNQPLAEGNDILTIIPGTISEEKMRAAVKATDSAVVMKVFRKYPQIKGILTEENLLAQGTMISRCGLDGETRFTHLDQKDPEELNYLSTLLTRRRGYDDTRPEEE